MTTSTKAELLQLIESEIDLGMTFAETALVSSGSHIEQAQANARKACETAVCFMGRVSESEIPAACREKLEKLRVVVGYDGSAK